MEENTSSLELIGRESFRRSISNYYFITINVIMFLSNMFLTTELFGISQASKSNAWETVVLISTAIMSMVGYLLCVYWYTENRERSLRMEVTYRVLMEEEKRKGEEGLLSREWQFLGDIAFRKSPIPLSRLAYFLPIMFIGAHSLPLYIAFLSRFIMRPY